MKKWAIGFFAVICLLFLAVVIFFDVQTMFCSTAFTGLHVREIHLEKDRLSMEIDTNASAPLFQTCQYEIAGDALYLTIYTSLWWGEKWPHLVLITDKALCEVETIFFRDGEYTHQIYPTT